MKLLPYAQKRAVARGPFVRPGQTIDQHRDMTVGSLPAVLLSDDYKCAPCNAINAHRAADEANGSNPEPIAIKAAEESLNFENFLKIEKLERNLKATQLRLHASERALFAAQARAEALQNRLAELEASDPIALECALPAARTPARFLGVWSSIHRFFARLG
ncbi:MAG TPA: hypothetical protein VGY53_03165 [Isosphaeraceae bacterium]|nr:hypothetical protein [Isosphaeraceae bacterium]